MRERAGDRWEHSDDVFTTRRRRPIEPRDAYRPCTQVAGNTDLPAIRLHDVRHG